tara:strand:- start:20863 stop:21120 length:258 start_codon:yes stop_codon:yes gene_type:complete
MAKAKKVKSLSDVEKKIFSDIEMNKKIDDNPIKVKTPYPEEHKKADVDFIGEELVKLSNRLNEIELSVSDISIQLKQVRSRMGLI